MASPFDPGVRDLLVREFRRRVYDQIGFTPITHQAEWQCATEGWQLSETVLALGPTPALPNPAPTLPSLVVGRSSLKDPTIAQYERRLLLPRPDGIAHHVADLGAYKSGKSYGLGLWASGFACLPSARVTFVGLEYKTTQHEFQYLADVLCSRTGLALKHRRLFNDPRGGRMELILKNGAQFDCASWENKETLKGHEKDCYVFCEAYQLPGIESFTSIAQNLRARRGLAIWATTCDRPWVKMLHDMGHGRHADWHCTCGVPGWINPHTFDIAALVRDCPDVRLFAPYLHDFPWLKSITADQVGGLMTRERFEIAWLGKLGAFFGSVYNFQMGQWQCSPHTHPHLWSASAIERAVTDLTHAAR